MRAKKRNPHRSEFGDFQTPLSLSKSVCQYLARRRIVAASVVEPTCGVGNLLLTVLEVFPAATALGVEINPAYVRKLEATLQSRGSRDSVRVLQQSFFDTDWQALLRDLPEPLLVVGNPPWVTNSQLGALDSENLPQKSNFQERAGLDALTGKSNFDISEWMLIRLLEALGGRGACLAMLCKTAVARKVLLHAWKNGITLDSAEVRSIDAANAFDAAVDACLLVCVLSPAGTSESCRVYPSLTADKPKSTFGWCDRQLVADVTTYTRWKHLAGESPYQWRSGVKHDCAKVMELRKEAGGYRNGLGEVVSLEDHYLFPLLKSSEVASGRVTDPSRFMLMPQRALGEDTAQVAARAPRTWQYLIDHGTVLDRRGSSLYRNRPRFSVFGVGDYTFAPWKVAISGFYKRLTFTVVGSSCGRPVVFDDTVNFVPCQSEDEARTIASILNSKTAKEFYSSFVFWDAKRPITVDLLRRLDMLALAREQGTEEMRSRFLAKTSEQGHRHLELFEAC